MFFWQIPAMGAILAFCRDVTGNRLNIITAGSHADRAREPGQAGNRAAISVCLVVPWQTRPLFLFIIYDCLFDILE